MARTTAITKQDVINDVHRVAAITQTGKVRVTDYTKNGAFSLGTITRMFGAAKNNTFNQILGMDRNDDILDRSTLMMLTRKFAKQMEENGLEFNIETFEKTANFDVSMLAQAYGSIEKGLIAADVIAKTENVTDNETDDKETTDDTVSADEDNQTTDEDQFTDEDQLDEEDPTVAPEDDVEDYTDEVLEDEFEDISEDDDNDTVEDFDIDDFDLSDFDLDIDDLNDDEAFHDAMADSYEDDFYKEEDLKAAQMEVQQLFGGMRW